MSLSDAAEADLLKLLFLNTTWAAFGDATGIVGSAAPGSMWISLHTADPGEAGTQAVSEAAYTGYARVGVARSVAGWVVSGTAPTQVANAAIVTFPACTASAALCTHFAVGKVGTGATEIIVSGPLTSSLAVSAGITPSFAIGALSVTAD